MKIESVTFILLKPLRHTVQIFDHTVDQFLEPHPAVPKYYSFFFFRFLSAILAMTFAVDILLDVKG